jgi:hypothetical protein
MWHPELISDGGGLAFPPTALTDSGAQLDPEDPAVAALIAQLTRTRSKGSSRLPWKRATPTPTPTPTPAETGSALQRLDGWRLLARSAGEVLFGRGRPPQLLTVAVAQDGRRNTWTCVGMSAARQLRATRDGIRASGWRLDLSREVDPEETVLRVLVTEQTWSGGQRADSRLLAPDLHDGADELVLTMFVTPRPGFQIRSPNPETPARIALPRPVGLRRLIDGALYDRSSADRLPTGGDDTESV